MTERKNNSSNKFQLELPYLVEVQKASYDHFLQNDVPPEKRLKVGLERVFQDIFPITDLKRLFALKYEGYFFGIPKYSLRECRERGLTHSVPLHANLSLQVFEEDGEDRKLKEEIKNDVLICDLPIMTENGTFIINGAERVVVSQLHRSPGVSFDEEILPNGRSNYKSRIIPHRGAWVEFNTDGDVLYLIIDRKKKIPATALLRCIGFETTGDIISLFYKNLEKVTLHAGDMEEYYGRIVAADVIDESSGEVLLDANRVFDDKCAARLTESGVFDISFIAEDEENMLVHNTLLADKCKTKEDALKLIYFVMHQSQEEAPNMATAQIAFESTFLDDPRKYDLGEVGRYRLNAKVYTPSIEKILADTGLSKPSLTTMTMTEADFLGIFEYMVGLYCGAEGYVLDDIDHLGNRRTRSVGELVANQLSVGLSRMSRVIRENFTSGDNETPTPRDLVNTRTVNSVVQAFFSSSQLSQFMDQMNPLSELTHKRRLSALGPGGLSRERAGFEVRDVHYTHYGRLCPIETPEGPNIGLINSLATYAVVNHFGFIETPYRIVGLQKFKAANGKTLYFPEEKWHFGLFKGFVREPRLFVQLELSAKEMAEARSNLDANQRVLFDSFVNKVFEFKNEDGSSDFIRNGNPLEAFKGKADYVLQSSTVYDVVSSFVVYLTADEEDAFNIAPANTELKNAAFDPLFESMLNNASTEEEKADIRDRHQLTSFVEDFVMVREKDEYPLKARVIAGGEIDESDDFEKGVVPKFNVNSVDSEALDGRIQLMDVSPQQIISVAAGLIPFLEHDDANRALMGSNMQRQAVPLLRSEAPVVGTGLERRAALDSGTVVRAKHDGRVKFVDAMTVVVERGSLNASGEFQPLEGLGENFEFLDHEPIDEYILRKFERSNQDSCINQKPVVNVGDFVKKGDVLADGASTDHGELALGKNILIAFIPWNGYNYEDAVIVSEELAIKDAFTSIHVEEYEVEVRETKRGPEELTREIPNVGEEALKNLDERGIIRVGAEVHADDILVGKVTPKGETELSPEERLLRAIFGEKAGDVRDTSLVAPPGMKGIVLETRVFSRKDHNDKKSRAEDQEKINDIKEKFQADIDKIKMTCASAMLEMLSGKVSGNIVDFDTHEVRIPEGTTLNERMLNSLDFLSIAPSSTFAADDAEVQEKASSLLSVARDSIDRLTRTMEKEIDKVTKGDELKPGVLQTVKVYIAKKKKLQVGDKMAGRHGNKGCVSKIVPVEDMPFTEDGRPIQILLNPLGVPSRMNVGQVLEVHLGWAAKVLGIKVATPVFDGASFDDIVGELERAYQKMPVVSYKMDPEHGQIIGKAKLYDGRTGEAFLNPVTIGYMYYLKLGHLVEDKIHARSIGSYALVTQQPLGGKAQFGGQRFGEMEVWALEAFGAANVLQEILTVKSDDVVGRSKTYEAIVKGDLMPTPGIPESLNVLLHELRGLGLKVTLD